jgi:hypothetical protein
MKVAASCHEGKIYIAAGEGVVSSGVVKEDAVNARRRNGNGIRCPLAGRNLNTLRMTVFLQAADDELADFIIAHLCHEENIDAEDAESDAGVGDGTSWGECGGTNLDKFSGGEDFLNGAGASVGDAGNNVKTYMPRHSDIYGTPNR